MSIFKDNVQYSDQRRSFTVSMDWIKVQSVRDTSLLVTKVRTANNQTN